MYDVFNLIAFAKSPITRKERASRVRTHYLERLNRDEKDFAIFVLDTYETAGENELSIENLRGLLELKYRTLKDANSKLGPAEKIAENYIDLQRELYSI